MSGTEDAKKYISDKINSHLKASYSGQKLWSSATHGATIIIVSFSAIAAALSQSGVQFGRFTASDIATVLSLIVTIVSTIQSKLGFERKWVTNRMTRSALCQLSIDQHMGADPNELAKALKDVLAKHDQAITSTNT